MMGNKIENKRICAKKQEIIMEEQSSSSIYTNKYFSDVELTLIMQTYQDQSTDMEAYIVWIFKMYSPKKSSPFKFISCQKNRELWLFENRSWHSRTLIRVRRNQIGLILHTEKHFCYPGSKSSLFANWAKILLPGWQKILQPVLDLCFAYCDCTTHKSSTIL